MYRIFLPNNFIAIFSLFAYLSTELERLISRYFDLFYSHFSHFR